MTFEYSQTTQKEKKKGKIVHEFSTTFLDEIFDTSLEAQPIFQE